MSAPKITLDSNSFINLFDRGSVTATSVEALSAIMRYGLSGKVEVAATTRVEADLAGDKDQTRKDTMLSFLSLLPVVSTVARWDTSKWGSDVWVGDNEMSLLAEIQRIVFPGLSATDRRYQNKQYDIDHLVGHKLNSRDIFVTDDLGIWRRRTELQAGPGIVVMKPEECLIYLDDLDRRLTPRHFPTDVLNPAYHSPQLQGEARFDYSNNNHRYSIGDGHFYFETQWSKASDRSIHALSDPPSINALALAKGAKDIRDIVDGAAYDFTSRARTPNVGQIVIWRNVNGVYSATKILQIQDDSRGGDHDELAFEYVILPEGSSDFSKASRAH